MKLLKPEWVHHDDKPIFSVDVHQNCMKFATGGQGNDSGRVVIWNLIPVLSQIAEKDESVPKMLCQMDNHLACVNCVRWSQNGHMLASGSDDKLVMIWKMSKGPSGVFGTGGITKNPESWKCVSTLRGHAGDVLDLAWSPQDRWLASCSVDNTIIIWDAQSLPTMISVLKGHSGLVKGVTWDPVGKFLASQSDDRSVKIWKTADWTCNTTVTEPFEECGGTTHILRLSWSPDGQYLVSAHAMNGGGPTAQIIEREGWKCDKDFVGHRKAVTCVRFHNSILKRKAPKSKKYQQYCCLAVGSRDRSLSVWMTALQRPLVVIHDLFNDSILDLSWGPQKCILLACSGDGTVACLQFSDKEIGQSLSEEDKNSLYQRIYGKSATVDVHGTPGRDLLIENALLLNSIEEKPKPPTLPIIEFQSQSESYINLEISEQNKTTDVIIQTTMPTTPNKAAINKQIETRTLDGKRRITPVFIPLSLEQGENNGTPPVFNSSSRNINEKMLDTKSDDAKFALPAPVKPIITSAEQTHLDNRLTKANTLSAPAKSTGILKSFSTLTSTTNYQTTSSGGPARINLNANNGNAMAIGNKSQIEVTKIYGDFRICLQNSNLKTTFGTLCKLICWSISSSEKIWETFIGSPVVNFCLCSKYVLLCSLDGTLRFLDLKNGISVLPIMNLATAAIQCAFCPAGNLAGVISECGLLRIWDIEKQKIFISSSCADIFQKSGPVVQFSLTEHGIPFVLFSNGNSYSYSQNMQCWLVLNSKDPILRHGLQTTIPKDIPKNIRLYPLMTVQTATTPNFGSNLVDIDNNWQSEAKLLFIENQIKLCEAINSPQELKYWYSMLGYHLAIQGTEKRLRLLLDSLLGPAHGFNNQTENTKILNIEKHCLLETVLNVIKSHVKWQRLYMEYYEQMNLVKTLRISNGDKMIE